MTAAILQASQLTAHIGSTSYLQPFTVTDLDNSKLVVWLIASGTQSFSNVRWGGAGGAPLTNRLNYTTTALQMWELVDLGQGQLWSDGTLWSDGIGWIDQTSDIYFEATTTDAMSMLALHIYDTDRDQVPTFAVNQGGVASDSSIRAQTVPADALAMDVLMIGSTTETPTLHGLSAGAVLYNQVSAGAHICSSTYPSVTEQSLTLGWNWTDAQFRHAMCYFSAAPPPLAPLMPAHGTLAFASYAPLAAATLIQILTPNVVLAASNLRDTLSAIPPQRVEDIDEAIAADDGEWWQAVDIAASTDVRLAFPAPVGQELTGIQIIKVRVRKTAGTNPIVTLQLWESGVQRSPETNATVTSLVGQIVELQFLASDLADPTGAGVEVRIMGTAVT